MARLPTPGSDFDVWGDILNDYLLKEHRPDGTHNVPSLLGVPAQSGHVAVSDPSASKGFAWQPLDAGSVGLGNVTNDAQLKATALDLDGTFSANSDGKVPSQKATKTYVDNAAAAAVPDATPSTKGKLKLSGDLAGTADAPAVNSRTVTRTVAMNGSAADYICDGSADETQINQAVSDVAALGGGDVLLRFSRNYSVSGAIRLKDNVRLLGEQHTLITLASGANSNVIQNDDTTNGNTGITIKNIEIAVNGSAQSANCRGVYLKSTSYCLVENVVVSVPVYAGIHLEGASDGNLDSRYNVVRGCEVSGALDTNFGDGIYLQRCDTNTLENCSSHNNAHHGLYALTCNTITLRGCRLQTNALQGAVFTTCNYCQCEQNLLDSNSSAGLQFSVNSNHNRAIGNTITNNGTYGLFSGQGAPDTTQSQFNTYIGNLVAYNNDDALVLDHSAYTTVKGNIVHYNGSHSGSDQGLPVDNSWGSVVIGNRVEFNNADGIELKNNSSYCTVAGNVCRNNSNPVRNGDTTGCGIVLRAGVTYCTIVGNSSYCDEATPSQRRGILLTGAGTDYNTVVGNTVYGNSVNQIELTTSQVGTHNEVHSNGGANLARMSDQPLTLNNSTTNNTVSIVPTGNVGSSRVKGALYIDNTGNLGNGLAVYSPGGSTGYVGPLMSLRVGDLTTNTTWDFDPAIALLTNVSTQSGMIISQNNALAASRAGLTVQSSVDQTTANVYGLLAVRQASANSTNRGVWIDHAGTGEGLQVRAAQGKGIIVTNNGNDIGLDIVHGGNSSSAITSLRVNSTNAGTGAAYALAVLAGRAGFGTSAPTAAVDTPAATTSFAGLRIRPGVAPSTPNSGDVWQDGTHLYIRIGSNTYQLDQQSPSGGTPSSNWSATDNGLLSWTYDYAIATLTTTVPTAGQMQCARLNVPAGTITNIILDIGTAGASLTSAGAALYQNGNLLGQTADQSTNWTSTNGKVIPLTSPASVTAGYVYVAFWANGTTLPAFQRAVQRSNANVGLSASNYRFATAGSGITTTPPSTLGTLSASSTAWWVGLS